MSRGKANIPGIAGRLNGRGIVVYAVAIGPVVERIDPISTGRARNAGTD